MQQPAAVASATATTVEPPYTLARTFRRWRSSNRAATPAIYRYP